MVSRVFDRLTQFGGFPFQGPFPPSTVNNVEGGVVPGSIVPFFPTQGQASGITSRGFGRQPSLRDRNDFIPQLLGLLSGAIDVLQKFVRTSSFYRTGPFPILFPEDGSFNSSQSAFERFQQGGGNLTPYGPLNGSFGATNQLPKNQFQAFGGLPQVAGSPFGSPTFVMDSGALFGTNQPNGQGSPISRPIDGNITLEESLAQAQFARGLFAPDSLTNKLLGYLQQGTLSAARNPDLLDQQAAIDARRLIYDVDRPFAAQDRQANGIFFPF